MEEIILPGGGVPVEVVAGLPPLLILDDPLFFGGPGDLGFEEDPLFFIQVGTDGDDTLVGDDGENNVILGLAGDDDITGSSEFDLLIGGAEDDDINGGAGFDIILDGRGNDRVNGGDDDDIMLFRGGAQDRADGGDGEDLFILSDAFFENQDADRVKILNFDVDEDVIDIGMGQIASVRELNKEVQITFEGDGDMLVVRGTNSFEDINFIDLDLPSLADVLEFAAFFLGGDIGGQEDEDDGDDHMGGDDGENDGDMDDGGNDGDMDDDGEITGTTFFAPDDGLNLRGTEGNDAFIFQGDATGTPTTTVALGGEGDDQFLITSDMLSNGAAEKIKIRDYTPGEDEVLVAFTPDPESNDITDVKVLANRTQIFLGTEGDFIEFVGITDPNSITLISDFDAV